MEMKASMFEFEKMKVPKVDGSDNCTTMRINLMLLSCTLRYG